MRCSRLSIILMEEKRKMDDKKLMMHIVGNRPQFIKLAPLSHEIRKRGHREMIVHTGQHFDANMSDIFFEELDIPKPDVNLHISGGSHAEMTAKMLVSIEKVLLEHRPDIVILYGDTNSTLAAALAARKLNLTVAHVEAGPRTGAWTNPEETNRIVTDHVSDILFSPDMASLENLRREGLEDRAYFTGDVMYDSFLHCRDGADAEGIMGKYGVSRGGYVLMTWHRQENTADSGRMKQILHIIEKIGTTVLYPMHPRTRKMLEEFHLMQYAENIGNLKIVQPVGYQEMVALSFNCRFILTDSGGLSKESYFAGVKCLFMMEKNVGVWPDLVKSRWIIHVQTADNITKELLAECCDVAGGERPHYYGDGCAAGKMVDILEKELSSEKK